MTSNFPLFHYNNKTMSDSSIYDIIIVGAGPAGSVAAIYARQKGFKTLLLEKSKFPRDKICGDAVSGKSMNILKELNLLEKAQKLPGAIIDSITFGSPSNDQVNIGLMKTKNGTPGGLVIKRIHFDNFLFEHAKASGCEIIEQFKTDDIIVKDGFLKGVKGKDKNGKKRAFEGKIILGADGYNSIIARKTGLYKHEPEHWVVALRQYYKNVSGMNGQLEIHYTKKAQPGYFWIFPLENGYANVGIGMLHKTLKAKKLDLKVLLDDTINHFPFKERFQNAQAIENPVGWNLPVASKRRKSYGNGFMLLGDAAGLIDPFTGEGIGNALYSAKYAVNRAAEAIEINDFSAAFFGEFENRLWNTIGNELSVSTRLQKVGRITPLLNFVIGKASRNENVKDIISGMMRNEVPKKQLANPLFYIKLLFT